jgi:hypothetical protein
MIGSNAPADLRSRRASVAQKLEEPERGEFDPDAYGHEEEMGEYSGDAMDEEVWYPDQDDCSYDPILVTLTPGVGPERSFFSLPCIGGCT